MSALPPKADMCGAKRNFRFGPKADIVLIDHFIGVRQANGWSCFANCCPHRPIPASGRWRKVVYYAKMTPATYAREDPMAYDLNRFIADCRNILSRDPGPAGREQVRVNLERLLANKDLSKSIAVTQCQADSRSCTGIQRLASRFLHTSTTRRGSRRRTIMAPHGPSTARPPNTLT